MDACLNVIWDFLGSPELSRPTERVELSGEPFSFEDVSFSYDGVRRVIDGVTLSIPEGATCALVGPSGSGKTTLVSRVLKEFKQEDGWRVITIPETATELISGFGIKPFDNCMSMLQFQDFVVGDQIHKEKLALDAAQLVPS